MPSSDLHLFGDVIEPSGLTTMKAGVVASEPVGVELASLLLLSKARQFTRLERMSLCLFVSTTEMSECGQLGGWESLNGGWGSLHQSLNWPASYC